MEKPAGRKYPQVNTITDQARIGMVKEIFSTVTEKYDFLNHLLSLRRDVAWRRFMARKMHFFKTNRYLDVACGTGDLVIAVVNEHPKITAAGIDFVVEMVQMGKSKMENFNVVIKNLLNSGDNSVIQK